MAKKARAAIGTTTLTAIADCGCFKGEEVLACHEAGICALVPPTKTSGAEAYGRFVKADFIYHPQKNEYRCTAGEALIWRFASVEKGMTNPRYWSSNCKGCPLKDKCTPSSQRRVTGWEHQDVLAYNFKRLLTLLGMHGTLAAIRAHANVLTLRLARSFFFAGLAQDKKTELRRLGHFHALQNSPLSTQLVSRTLLLSFYTAWTDSGHEKTDPDIVWSVFGAHIRLLRTS